MRLGALFIAIALAALPVPGFAQPAAPGTVDLAGLIELALEPRRDADWVQQRLAEVLPAPEIAEEEVPLIVRDPMAWVVSGAFGPVAETGEFGGYVSCSRYGLPTRDFLAERALSDPETFALFSLYQIEADEASAWPDAAMARLSCQISWDDSRAVRILPEGEARGPLEAAFAAVDRAEPANQAWFYGTDGYRLNAVGGRSDSVVVLDRMVVILTLRYQVLRVRSFAIGGGV
ncbi:MAG: hypothetical protein AAGA70_00840 [Pseudomonadota bacterium]